ncbi:hypothetical protein CSKR_109742 [Clonorchis sinensis]|uniref:Uncharacterized protein n=1 Tax=Clonorchis sinensis TaxID=79923 RepID=A0A419QDF8_CLOSI|nr:hypothetical protein CSKR_109742 [Clonorchis sinensis]
MLPDNLKNSVINPTFHWMQSGVTRKQITRMAYQYERGVSRWITSTRSPWDSRLENSIKHCADEIKVTYQKQTSKVKQCGVTFQSRGTKRSVIPTGPLPLDFRSLGLANLAVSQPSRFLRVAWQLDTEGILQLNDYDYYCLQFCGYMQQLKTKLI